MLSNALFIQLVISPAHVMVRVGVGIRVSGRARLSGRARVRVSGRLVVEIGLGLRSAPVFVAYARGFRRQVCRCSLF